MSLPTSLAGTAFVNHEPWSEGFVRLHPYRNGETSDGYFERLRPDRHGAFRFDRVPPGEYRLVGFLEGSGERFEFAEPIVLQANQLAQITFRASR